MASKINKTGLSQTILGKSSPASQRAAAASKPSRIVSKSEPNTPSPTPRVTLDRSSSLSKPSSEKKSPKVPTPPEKTQVRAVKGSDTQPRLIQIKEDLRKANEVIASLENEKAKTLEELKEARREAEEVSGKLVEAIKAQKKAEEDFEIEKFEAVEAGIDAVQRKEEELKKELENVKRQHALDSASLFSLTQELAVANDAKSKALRQAEDASKMAVIHAEKVEILSSELIRLKALLDSTREKETITNKEIASKLGAEIEALKGDLDKARSFEAEVKEQAMIIEKLCVDLEAAKISESYAKDSAHEWQSKAEELEEELEEANKRKRSASVSLSSVTKQLQDTNDSLHDMESETTGLKERIRLLETTVARQKEDLEKSEQRLVIAEEEAEKLKKELGDVNEEKNQSLKKEQEAASSVQMLMEEKEKILTELGSSKEEEEKSKKAMESLTLALHEVTSEARELKEKLLSRDCGETEIEDLKLVNRTMTEKYEKMLAEARHEIEVLVGAVEQTKSQFESSMVDWEMREAGLVNHVKKFDEEVFTMGKEMNRLGNLLKRKKEEADAAWKKESEMRDSLKEVEDEVIYLQETLREATSESLKLKEKMSDKETEFQSVVRENDELRAKQDDSVKKIEELSKLLEEALAKKDTKEKGGVSESGKENDMLPKVVEFCEENGHKSAEENSYEVVMNKKLEVNTEENERKEDSLGDDRFPMWESFQVEKKEEKPEQETSREDENTEETAKVFGEDEMVKEEKKKKKTLFGKVGNLLKKKGSISHK